MNFKQNLLNNIIEPSMKSKLSTTIARVSFYDNITHTASIYFKNGTRAFNLDNVPIQISGIGLHSSSLQYGDFVYVQFNNNSIYQPKIIGYADEAYSINTLNKEKHLRKGSLIVSQKEIKKELQPNFKTWFCDDPKPFKYDEYKSKDAVGLVEEAMMKKGTFQGKEVGLYNPISSSIVKVLDDGTIDIFSSTNVGIRVNPISKTIEFYGDSSTKSNSWSLTSNTINIDAKCINIKGEELNLNIDKINKG